MVYTLICTSKITLSKQIMVEEKNQLQYEAHIVPPDYMGELVWFLSFCSRDGGQFVTE